jgi:hypothetical protein
MRGGSWRRNKSAVASGNAGINQKGRLPAKGSLPYLVCPKLAGKAVYFWYFYVIFTELILIVVSGASLVTVMV